MSTFEDTMEVDVPVRVAYHQWTRFEDFPEFLAGVDSVTQLGPATIEWVATIGGRRRRWRARIVERTPDVRVAWQSMNGGIHDGVVLFRPRGLDRTLVTLRLHAEQSEDADPAKHVDHLERQVRGDLRRFKAYVEAHLVPTGPWLGQRRTIPARASGAMSAR